MNTDRLLKELAKRDIVSPKVLKSLEAKLADKSDVPSPRSVAKFLVDKGHLTVSQAKKVLKAILTPEESAILDSSPIEDELPELPSLSNIGGESTAAAEPEGPDLGGALSETRSSSKSKDKKGKRTTKRQKEFDSPLMLMGGGALILMLLVGGGIAYLMNRESADALFKNAEDAYNEGAYKQAVAEFQRFTEKKSGDDRASLARVRLGTARIRMMTDVAESFEGALEEAIVETDVIEDEPAYKEGQKELAQLLPLIAEKLVEDADAASDIDSMQKYVKLTNDALALCANGKLIPPNLRDKGQLDNIRDKLELINSRQQALETLRDTIASMKKSAADGKPAQAYESYVGFIKTNPEHAQNEGLIGAIAAAAETEKGLIRFVQESRPAETSEPQSPVNATLAVAFQRQQAKAPATGVAAFRLASGLYGVSATDGKLLWKRTVGVTSTPQQPLRVGDDLLVVDAKRKELVRLNAESGSLVWRQSVEEDIAQPVVAGQRVMCAALSGKLLVIDAATGALVGSVPFAQPLRSSPAVSSDGKTIYLAGEHSTLYSLSTADLSCTGVMYLGHAKGAVVAPPVELAGRVLVFENDGAETSRLHVLKTSDQGAAESRLTSQRINGLVTARPDVFGRRFALVTDVGQVDVFEVSPDNDQQPMVQLASRKPKRGRNGERHALVVDGNLWLADTGLAKYSISPVGNRLPIREVAQPFRRDRFVHPLIATGKAVLHARQRSGESSVTIAATDVESGEAYWQTDLAAPPAGEPVTQAATGGILYATTAGDLLQLDRPQQQFQVINRPAPLSKEPSYWQAGSATPAGQAVFWAVSQGRVGPTGPDGKASAPYALPSPLACEPVRMGKGWVAPLTIGQVYYIQDRDGASLAAPFQPALSPGTQLNWRTPGVADNRVVMATDKAIYSIELIAEEPARLEQASMVAAAGEQRVTGRIAAAGGLAFAARENGRLTALDSLSLEEAASVDLGSRAVWGPYSIGERVLVAAGGDRLVCVDASSPGKAAWETEIKTADLVGPPLASGDAVTIARRSGKVMKLDVSSGSQLNTIDLGQRLASGPASYGKGLVFYAAADAVLFVQQL